MAAQKVDTAEFEIRTEKSWHICTHADFLHHAKQFNSFLGACPDAFAGLRSLWLFNMRFGELDMPIILGTCKRLESLHLTRCYSGIHSVLQVEHAQLVELEIGEGKFERIELTCLPKLQQIWVLPECPEPLTPLLSKLQRVNLDNLPEGCDLSWTMFILDVAPSLEELFITVWDHWCNMVKDPEFEKENGYCEKENVKWKPSISDFKHKNLAKLRIYGFQPDDKCTTERCVDIVLTWILRSFVLRDIHGLLRKGIK